MIPVSVMACSVPSCHPASLTGFFLTQYIVCQSFVWLKMCCRAFVIVGMDTLDTLHLHDVDVLTLLAQIQSNAPLN